MDTQLKPSPKQQLAMCGLMGFPFLICAATVFFFTSGASPAFPARLVLPAFLATHPSLVIALLAAFLLLIFNGIPLFVGFLVFKFYWKYDPKMAKRRGFIVSVGPLGLLAVAGVALVLKLILSPHGGHNDWSGVALVFVGPIVAVALGVLISINFIATILIQRAFKLRASAPLAGTGGESRQFLRWAQLALVLIGLAGCCWGFYLLKKRHAESVWIQAARKPTKERQEAEGKIKYANSLGMKFVAVPGTEVLFCVWETRVQDYRVYANENTSVDGHWQNPKRGSGNPVTPSEDCPVVNVSWNHAQGFCNWLTKKERAEGKIGPGQSYRLPTDWEWSMAVGLNETREGTPEGKDGKTPGYPWGNQWPPPNGAGNYVQELKVDPFEFASPVGSFAPNQHGIYDLGGNVFEWCEDNYGSQGTARVLRGGSWGITKYNGLLSSARHSDAPDFYHDNYGFRVVLTDGPTPPPRPSK